MIFPGSLRNRESPSERGGQREWDHKGEVNPPEGCLLRGSAGHRRVLGQQRGGREHRQQVQQHLPHDFSLQRPQGCCQVSWIDDYQLYFYISLSLKHTLYLFLSHKSHYLLLSTISLTLFLYLYLSNFYL